MRRSAMLIAVAVVAGRADAEGGEEMWPTCGETTSSVTGQTATVRYCDLAIRHARSGETLTVTIEERATSGTTIIEIPLPASAAPSSR